VWWRCKNYFEVFFNSAVLKMLFYSATSLYILIDMELHITGQQISKLFFLSVMNKLFIYLFASMNLERDIKITWL